MNYFNFSKTEAMNKIVLCIFGILSLYSCTTKKVQILSGVQIGASEDQWRSFLRKEGEAGRYEMNTDTISGTYNWEILDTIFTVDAKFNGDGVPYGGLRVVYFNLNNRDGFTAKLFETPIDTFGTTDNGKELPDEFAMDACLKSRFDSLKFKLQVLFGKYDSIEINYSKINGDTLSERVYFSSDGYIVKMLCSKLLPPSKLIPFSHYDRAFVLIQHRDYEKLLASTISERLPKLKPSDVIKCTIPTFRVERSNGFGSKDYRLRVKGEVASYDRQDLTESRPIEGLKGKIYFLDKYSDTLDTYDDYDLPLRGSLTVFKPGLLRLEGTLAYSIETPTEIDFEVNIYHKDCSDKLRNAVLEDRLITAVFVPEMIKFSDGTILR